MTQCGPTLPHLPQKQALIIKLGGRGDAHAAEAELAAVAKIDVRNTRSTFMPPSAAAVRAWQSREKRSADAAPAAVAPPANKTPKATTLAAVVSDAAT